MKIKIFIFLMLSCLFTNFVVAAPKEFDTAIVEKEISWDKKAFTQIGILKWKVEEDERPFYNEKSLYIESALVVAKFKGKWALVHIYRHPKLANKWTLSVVFYAPHKSLELFDNLPSLKDLKTFEKDTWWTDKSGDRFKLIKSGIEKKNIEKFIKEK
ncbi:MAG: hypothetical protein HOI47_10155 [Candidatus Scalindua sp.]|jgi:hypothetical protein|nr:hypothetical protein [Candidatus Scalindua sp.]MBT6045982.1 hypothetical protein [Candidatus Scalindua sp.]MBT6227006.1 hypothetical protein [Candidatus Scalindua sp.]MBT7210032.1 hypothetical protein [Candidatus Scalindua sp.]